MNSKFLNYDTLEDINSESTYLPGSNSQAYDSNSSPYSEASPYHETDSLSDKSKKIRKKRNTYQKIDDATRMNLLDAVHQGETLKAAAKRYNINYSSAKSILHTYRKEGRILKKSAQERTIRRRINKETPSDMEMSPIYLSKDCQEDFSGAASTTYESPETQYRSPVYGFNEEQTQKKYLNGVTINSFGGFLKIGVQNQQKSEDLFVKQQQQPASTVVFKLDPNNLNQGMNNATKNVQRGNWQLNVNVRSDSSVSSQKTVEAPTQAKNVNALAISEKLKSFESFYMNYANSPLSRAVQIKKQESQAEGQFIPQDFNAFADMMTCNEDPYDISCFLNSSSPAYARQQKVYEFDPFAGENFSWMDNWREGQDFFCDEPKKGSYSDNFVFKNEEGNTRNVQSVELRSY